MAHLLPLWVVDTATDVLAVHRMVHYEGAVLSKVDFMVEEGGLRRRSGYDGDLGSMSNVCTATWESRQTHSLVVEEEDLHLGRGGARRSAVPDRHHLGDVAGDRLGDIHGCRVEDGRNGCKSKVRAGPSHSSQSVAAVFVVVWRRSGRVCEM